MDELRTIGRVLWGTIQEFFGDGCPRMAAAISYYSIFAIPAVLGLLALAAQEFVGPQEIQAAISNQIETLVGVESATQVVDVVQGAVDPSLTGPAALIGLVALIFGATGAFGEMQSALNIAWGQDQLEQSSWSNPAIVERVAADRRQMVFPRPDDVEILAQ